MIKNSDYAANSASCECFGEKMPKIFIDGQEGTTGLKLYGKLKDRNDLEILAISEEHRKNPTVRAELINESDLTFLCLPDAAAIEAVTLVENENTKIIDASTAHRTADGWVYGFPELFGNGETLVAEAKRVAVPGCHAGGFLSIVKPLTDAGILLKNDAVYCNSLTGYSGGGKKMIADYESKERDPVFDAPRPYALTQTHKHLKEMKRISGLVREPIFQPIVFDCYSGMATSIPLDLNEKPFTKQDVFDVLSSLYRNQPLVRVFWDEGESVKNGFLNANALSGRDDMEIVVTGTEKRVVVTAVFDNLGKGASGAAVECMNLMLGVDKTTGLNYKKESL